MPLPLRLAKASHKPAKNSPVRETGTLDQEGCCEGASIGERCRTPRPRSDTGVRQIWRTVGHVAGICWCACPPCARTAATGVERKRATSPQRRPHERDQHVSAGRSDQRQTPAASPSPAARSETTKRSLPFAVLGSDSAYSIVKWTLSPTRLTVSFRNCSSMLVE